MAGRTPNAFVSYDAASTTPPPTSTGRPRSAGSSRCSTEAKKASRSAWRMVGWMRTGVRLQPVSRQALRARHRDAEPFLRRDQVVGVLRVLAEIDLHPVDGAV